MPANDLYKHRRQWRQEPRRRLCLRQQGRKVGGRLGFCGLAPKSGAEVLDSEKVHLRRRHCRPQMNPRSTRSTVFAPRLASAETLLDEASNLIGKIGLATMKRLT